MHDTVVIGGGLAGLSAAASLAKNGRRVAVVEQNDEVGGNCSDFTIDGYRFDRAVHLVDGVGEKGRGAYAVKSLGLADDLDFVAVDPMYRAFFPDLDIDFSLDADHFFSTLAGLFPGDRKGLDKLRKKADALTEIIGLNTSTSGRGHQVSDLATVLKIPSLAYWFIRSGRRSFQEIMEDDLRDPRLIAILSSLWPYAGLPPARVFGLYLMIILASYSEYKAYYPRGGTGTITKAICEAARRAGAEVTVGRAVKKVSFDNHRVKGVELADGEYLPTRNVVGACDLNHLIDNLGAAAGLGRPYVRGIRRLRASIAPFRVFLGVESRPGLMDKAVFENFVFGSWDHDAVYTDARNMRPAFANISIPSLVDPSAAPPGCHAIAIISFGPFGNQKFWDMEKEAYADQLIDLASTVIPGLASSIRVKKILTPADLHARTNAFEGAMYGWDSTPEQVMFWVPTQKTPADGLYLAGHWTRPGAGCASAMLSGLGAANLIHN